MQRFKNILLVLSPEIEWAATLEKAVSLTKNNEGRLTVFSVLKEPPGTLGYSKSVAQQQLRAATVEREEWLRGLMLPFREDNIYVVNHVVEGVAFLEIIRQVLRKQHDLVITAAEERKGFRARLFGTITMHLMRKCPCPVWVVKRSQTQSYTRILAAVDPSDYDTERNALNPLILQLANSMARRNSAELHVVNVWQFIDGHGYYKEAAADVQILQRRTQEAQYKQRLDTLINKAGIHIAEPFLHLIEGDPEECIPALAEAQAIDLLVMGTVCRTGIAGFLIGNTAEEVLSQVDCSVFTVKPEGFVTPVTLEEPVD